MTTTTTLPPSTSQSASRYLERCDWVGITVDDASATVTIAFDGGDGPIRLDPADASYLASALKRAVAHAKARP